MPASTADQVETDVQDIDRGVDKMAIATSEVGDDTHSRTMAGE